MVRVCRAVVLLAVVVFGAAACRVSVDDLAVDARSDRTVLPELGPVPGASHWHAAYVVRICDEVLAPFDSTDDPLGIHSHSDGVIHIHPFFEESGYEASNLGQFADAMGLGLATGELTLPGGGTWRDGDLCGGVPGRVFVDRWRGPSPDSMIERVFVHPQDLRFLADGELYQIAFAPADSPPVIPPSLALLFELSALSPVEVEPWVDVDPTAVRSDASFWTAVAVTGGPCRGDAVSERVLSGTPRCYERGGDKLAAAEAVEEARAVSFNRQPAVELRITGALQDLIAGHFAQTDEPLTLVIEIDGWVVTAPVLGRMPISQTRLVVSGGFSEQAARDLASVLGAE